MTETAKPEQAPSSPPVDQPTGGPQPGAPEPPPYQPDPALFAEMERSADPVTEKR